MLRAVLDFLIPDLPVLRRQRAEMARLDRLIELHDRLFSLTLDIESAKRRHKPRAHLMAERVQVRAAILRGGA